MTDYARGYRDGQESMREACAKVVLALFGVSWRNSWKRPIKTAVEIIRALPLREPGEM